MESTKRCLIYFLILLEAFNVSSLSIKKRIIGGPHADLARFNYQVSFRFKDKNAHYCSGAILNNWWIVTANRCVNTYSIHELKVVYGALRLSDPGITNEIERRVSHPDYNPRFIENNIALVMTKEKIDFIPETVGPINLAGRPWRTDDTVVISGWGVDKKENERLEEYSNVLRFQTTKTISTDDCKALTGPMGETIKYGTMVCTINPIGRGICKGDLGGPLINNEDELMGIASWHLNCAEGKPDVYTAVYPFVQWIQEVIEDERN